MRRASALHLAPGLVVLALAGCVRSINPIGGEADRIFDERLVGAWISEEVSEDAPGLYEVTADGQGSYRLSATDEECRQGTFTMYLTEAGGQRFLDVYPDEPDSHENDLYAMLMTRTFLVLRIEVGESELKTWQLDTDWFEERLEAKPDSVSRAALDDTLLTGSTEEVRALYLEYFKTPGALDEPGRLVRRSAEQAEKLRARCL